MCCHIWDTVYLFQQYNTISGHLLRLIEPHLDPNEFFLYHPIDQLQQLGLKFILQTKDRVLSTAQAGQSKLSTGTKRPGDLKQ